MNTLEEKIIKEVYANIMTKGEYPKFGSPEVYCDKCMFHNVTCTPINKYAVGCFHGWKMEEDKKRKG